MYLSFKTELKLNKTQKQLCLKSAGAARHAWNQCLRYTKLLLDVRKLQKEAGLEQFKFPSGYDLQKWHHANIKSQSGYEWYYEVSKCCSQKACLNLIKAWKDCFSKKRGAPRFKKRGRRDSFTLDGTIKLLDNNTIQVPKLGKLKTFERLPQVINPKSCTISRTADRWFISFRYEIEESTTPPKGEVVGVDLGIKTLAALSNGEKFLGTKSYRRAKAKLSRFQYLIRNKQRGSNRYKKAITKLQRLHMRVAFQRKDYLNKLTTYLASNFAAVCIEDLNVSGMMSNHKLAAAIADMGFFEFRRQLDYKCKKFGSKLVITNRWEPTTKTCSKCHAKQPMTLGDRIFDCQSCSNVMDRDYNAALNILRLGLQALTDVELVGPTPSVEASSIA